MENVLIPEDSVRITCDDDGESHIKENNSLSVSKKNIYFQEEDNLLVVLNDLTVVKDLEEAKSQVKYKAMLMATISHDLRTPANSILAMLQLLEDYIPFPQLQFLNVAKSSCNMLLLLIHDVLVLYIYIYIYFYIYICRIIIQK